VLLWRKGEAKPAIVGKFAQQGSVLVGRIRYADLSSVLDLRSAPPELSIDVCTGHHDAPGRVYEEYYHATIRLGQIPVSADEGTLFL
jgi:hypothetical protein